MAIKVRLFARAREAYGHPETQLEFEAAPTPAACLAFLATSAPALEGLRPSLLVAVNEEYAEWDAELTDGDEVAFIPPVSGG